MIRNKKLNLLIFATVLFFIIALPLISHAETHIYQYDVRQNWLWDKEGSPYILEEPIYIPDNSSLYIKEGVEIFSASTTGNDYPNSITSDGYLTIMGTKEQPVKFDGLYSLYISNNTSIIKYTIFNNTGLDFTNSSSTIDSVIIKNSVNGIFTKASHLDINNSNLSSNTYGIFSSNHDSLLFQVKSNKISSENTGGIGNALYGMTDYIPDPQQNIISIHNSVILGNKDFGIFNQTVNPVEASDNWWGNVNGPINDPTMLLLSNRERVAGLVNVAPWKDKDPNITSCCSNVLFIPGIEASRLYKDKNMLWEPNRNDDVKKIFMDSNGVSIDKTIYTKDIIDSAYSLKNIYRNFIMTMNTLVDDKTINKWQALPYDWRNGVYDIVDQKILDNVYELAESSQTGRVTIISHSNGGLLAKVLIKKLEDLGKSNLIENSISVAVPELGTPQSILSMLHGYSQSIAGGLFLSENTARDFSKNLPGAYGLLPSREFYNKSSPVVISDFFTNDSNKFISSYESVKNFLLDNSFSQSSSTNLATPLLLNKYLLSIADSFHSIFDNWKASSKIKTLSIFGWGVPTVKSVVYEKDKHCNERKGEICNVEVVSERSRAGDGTVLTIANSNNADKTLFFDLKNTKGNNNESINHSNILESPVLDNLIVDNIKNKTIDINKDYGKYFSEIEPVDMGRTMIIKIYSPVDIDVYDNEGGHTGLIRNPIKGVDINKYESNISSSFYADYNGLKILEVPYDNDYQIILSGNDNGTFYVDVDIKQFDKVIASTTFGEMETTPFMTADFIISTSTNNLATSSFMKIDTDGDMVPDIINYSDQFKEIYKNSKSFEKIKKDSKDKKIKDPRKHNRDD